MFLIMLKTCVIISFSTPRSSKVLRDVIGLTIIRLAHGRKGRKTSISLIPKDGRNV